MLTSANAAAWMPLIREHLPTRFTGHALLARIASRLALFPATGLIALELHVSEKLPRVDLSQRFETPEQALAFVRRLGDTSLDSLLGSWSSGGLAQASDVWVEMDFPPEPAPQETSGAAPKPPRPGLVTCVRLRRGAEPEWIADRLAPCFRAGGLTTPQRETLLAALEHLRHTDGRPIYLFDLEPRSPGLIRLDTLGLDRLAMVAYLSRVAPDAAATIARLPTWMDDVERHHLSFDILPDGSIGERLGVELSNVKLPLHEPRWTRLLDHLVDDGLVAGDRLADDLVAGDRLDDDLVAGDRLDDDLVAGDRLDDDLVAGDRLDDDLVADEPTAPGTRDAVMHWTGKDDRHSASGVWPGDATLTNGCCVRVISHVKLVARRDSPLTAKIYLLLQYLDRKAILHKGRSRATGLSP